MDKEIKAKTNELIQWSESISNIWNQLHLIELPESIDMDLLSNACEAIEDIANEIDQLNGQSKRNLIKRLTIILELESINDSNTD